MLEGAVMATIDSLKYICLLYLNRYRYRYRYRYRFIDIKICRYKCAADSNKWEHGCGMIYAGIHRTKLYTCVTLCFKAASPHPPLWVAV